MLVNTTACAAPRSPSACARVSAERLHALALEAHRIGNRGRLSLCEALHALAETRLHFGLGFPSVIAYAAAHFHLRRAETFEYLRVARSLAELTLLREAFAQGRLGWSTLKAITRVATIATQDEWIEFSRQHGVERTLAEARQALHAGRRAPRSGTFGLPNLDQKLVLRFSRSDLERVRSWIDAVSAAVAEKTGAEEVSAEQALLFVCEQEPMGRPARHRAQVVYQRCSDCQRSRVQTSDGFVEVAPDEVERHEGCAEAVVLDGPTPARLRRRVLAREGHRCGNPRCHHRADHCHHIVFRSRGGPTSLANEVAVCATCHALIHSGLLRVARQADGELRWSPAVDGESLGQAVRRDGAEASQLAVIRIEVPNGGPGVASRRGQSASSAWTGQESATADSVERTHRSGLKPDELAQALQRLGVGVMRARRLIDAALAALPVAEQTEANILRRALSALRAG